MKGRRRRKGRRGGKTTAEHRMRFRWFALLLVAGIFLGAMWGEEVRGVVAGRGNGISLTLGALLRGGDVPEAVLASGRRVSTVGVEGLPPGDDGPVIDPAGSDRAAPPLVGASAPVAVVLDDFGPNLAVAEATLELGFPVTIAVLPGYAFSREIAQRAASKGVEVLLHQPMEPETAGSLPGPGTLYTWMSESHMREVLSENLAELGIAVAGLNNHMGSGFTADEEAMTLLLGELKERKLYFLDSVTTGDTVGSRVGRSLGIPVIARSVFLDDPDDSVSLETRWEKALARARSGHPTVVIGHGRWETIRFLRGVRTQEALVDFCILSDMIRESGTETASGRRGPVHGGPGG